MRQADEAAAETEAEPEEEAGSSVAVDRPVPLSVIAVVAAFAGGSIFAFGISVAVAAMAGILLENALYPGLNAVFGMLGLIAVAAGAGFMVFAYGAWRLRPWAWKLGLALSLLAALTLGPVGLVAGGLSAFYLLRADVREALGRR